MITGQNQVNAILKKTHNKVRGSLPLLLRIIFVYSAVYSIVSNNNTLPKSDSLTGN